MTTRRTGPSDSFRPSRLREDAYIVGRTQAEIITSMRNAKGEAAYQEALENCRGWFEDCPIAVEAHRLGQPPRRDTIPATNASSLYSSALASNTRRR